MCIYIYIASIPLHFITNVSRRLFEKKTCYEHVPGFRRVPLRLPGFHLWFMVLRYPEGPSTNNEHSGFPYREV